MADNEAKPEYVLMHEDGSLVPPEFSADRLKAMKKVQEQVIRMFEVSDCSAEEIYVSLLFLTTTFKAAVIKTATKLGRYVPTTKESA